MKENPKFNGIELDENNQPIKGTEFTGWYSRSIAVVVIVTDSRHEHFLIERRGTGCPDNQGKLCMPCGYLNWDETLKDAAIREVYEETGLLLKHEQLRTYGSINDNPTNNRQNVSIYFIAELPDDYVLDRINIGAMNTDTKSRGGENNECAQIMWASENFIQIYKHEFCFDHDKILLNMIEINNFKRK